jgi:hypothetical protein
VSRNVEFLDLEDGARSVDDLLDAAAPSRSGRGRALLAASAACALLAVLVLRTSASRPADSVKPVPLPHPAPVPAPTLVVPGPDPFGAGNLSMTFGGGRLFALSATRLGVLDPASSSRRTVPVSLYLASEDSFGLVWDEDARGVWLMPLFGREPEVLRQYDADLRQRRTVSLPEIAHAGAVLDGSLYVSTDSGLQRVGPSGQVQPVPLPSRAFHRYGAFGDVQADPTRHRLLYLTYSYSAYLETWSPRTRASHAVRLTVANPTLAVVAGQIWVAGFRRSTGVVERLDPTTLRPVATSPLSPALGPGAVIVDAGHNSILVRSGTDPGPLWCLDARDGRVRQRWAGPTGAVSGAGRSLFVSTTWSVRQLTVAGCPG